MSFQLANACFQLSTLGTATRFRCRLPRHDGVKLIQRAQNHQDQFVSRERLRQSKIRRGGPNSSYRSVGTGPLRVSAATLRLVANLVRNFTILAIRTQTENSFAEEGLGKPQRTPKDARREDERTTTRIGELLVTSCGFRGYSFSAFSV